MQAKRKWKQEQLIKQREMGFGAGKKEKCLQGRSVGKNELGSGKNVWAGDRV